MFKNIKLKKALIGAGLGVLGVGTIVGTTWGISEIVSNRQNVDGIEDLTPGTPLIDGVESNENESVHEMPKQITFTRYAKQATSNNTLTVTCTVLPADTVNKKLTWTLQWADGGNHGTVTDYVKMSVNSDTSQCTIQSLKEWDYKIKLVVKTTDGSNLSKECTLDYLGRNVIFDSQKVYNTITPDTNIMNYVNYVISQNKVTTNGGTLAGNVVVDGVVIQFGGEYNCTLRSSDDYGFLDFSVTSSSTFYDFYYGQGLPDGYATARDFMNDVNGKTADMYIEYHLEYNGVTYLTKEYKYNNSEDQTLFVGFVDINNNSYLKASSLSLNDTSFIF